MNLAPYTLIAAARSLRIGIRAPLVLNEDQRRLKTPSPCQKDNVVSDGFLAEWLGLQPAKIRTVLDFIDLL